MIQFTGLRECGKFGMAERTPLISHDDRMMIDDTVVLSAFSCPEKRPGNTVSNAKIVRVVQGTGDLYSATHFLFKKDTVLCGSRPLCAPLPGG